jgi:hypothetical protein
MGNGAIDQLGAGNCRANELGELQHIPDLLSNDSLESFAKYDLIYSLAAL